MTEEQKIEITRSTNSRGTTPVEMKKLEDIFHDCGAEIRDSKPSEQVNLQEASNTAKAFPDIDAKVKVELKKLIPDLQKQGVSSVILGARPTHEQYEGLYTINAQGGNTFQVTRIMNNLAITLTEEGIDMRLGSLECPGQGVGIGIRIPRIGAAKQ